MALLIQLSNRRQFVLDTVIALDSYSTTERQYRLSNSTVTISELAAFDLQICC